MIKSPPQAGTSLGEALKPSVHFDVAYKSGAAIPWVHLSSRKFWSSTARQASSAYFASLTRKSVQPPVAMARSKQPAVKRESSSEYFNKNTATWEGSNGVATNGHATNGAAVKKDVEEEKKEAGVLQLVIAVAGIYASL